MNRAMAEAISIVSVELLSAVMREVIREELAQMRDHDNNITLKQAKMLTRSEAARLLRISLPTLTKHVKAGNIPGYRLGAKILFRKDEILESLESIQKLKFRKHEE